MPHSIAGTQNYFQTGTGPLRLPESIAETQTLAEGLWKQFAEHLPALIGALVALTVFIVAGRVFRGVTRRALERRDPTLAHMLADLVHAALIVFGVLVACWIAFPSADFQAIFTSLGLTGLILGFALRDLIENFASGLPILWRRPFKIGDQIRTSAYQGMVEEVNFRSTILKTADGTQVYIPNGSMFTKPLENISGYGIRRLEIALGIEQNAAVSDARRVILAELVMINEVLAEPPPIVLFDRVGDFANELQVMVWIESSRLAIDRQVRSEITERLYGVLTRNGIGMPYPIQTVRLESPRSNGT
jgi:small-conductance mechanosensitive channel